MGRENYRHLASVYDRLMESAPYDRWLQWTEAQWSRMGVQPRTVVDLACGTGTLTWRLVKTGRTVIGVDRSADMLAVAAGKEGLRHGAGSAVQWLEQDMRELILPRQADAVVCFCDSLNYLLTEEDWKRAFEAVHKGLAPKGVFLFDIHSPYKIADVLGDQLFAWEEADVYCVLNNQFDRECGIVNQALTFFVEQRDGKYDRFDEWHRQRTFPVHTVVKWLEETGFSVQSVSADFEIEGEPKENSERLFFAAQKR